MLDVILKFRIKINWRCCCRGGMWWEQSSVFWYSVGCLELTVTSACSLTANSETDWFASASARVSWRLPTVQVRWQRSGKGGGWVWQYDVTVVVMRPKVKGGLCSAVRVTAWGSILPSLYLGQIFARPLEEITKCRMFRIHIQIHCCKWKDRMMIL